MTEQDFFDSVDCKFPYDDEAAGAELVREACRISANACFMIGEELSRPPRSVVAPIDVRLRILALLREGFEHPIRDKVLDVVATRISGGSLGFDETLALMREIEPFRNEYCAMNIIYFACDEDFDVQLDAEYTRIRSQWAVA